MRIRSLSVWLLVALINVAFGCATGLPSGTKTTESPWSSFSEIKNDYDKVVPFETTVEKLKKIKIDPFAQPNVAIKRHSWVVNYFLPNQSIKKEDLDTGLLKCIDAGNYRCYGLQIEINNNAYKQYGSLLKNWIGIEKNTLTEGWYFYALIIVKDGIVVYKEWEGTPNITARREDKKPLGPLQGGGSMVIDTLKKTVPGF